MILVIDNFDSFTYNLVDYFEQLNVEVDIIRNDVLVQDIAIEKYQGVVLSPGPETPEKANNLMKYLAEFTGKLPILGVCLGHQAINVHFGGSLKKGIRPMHGKISTFTQRTNDAIFDEMSVNFEVVRYHSLEIDRLGKDLVVLGHTEDNSIMVIKHKLQQVYGLQFHPESILTQFGLKILENWLKVAGISNGNC